MGTGLGGRRGNGASGLRRHGAGRLVIGIGNSLRQDDGVGWRVAEVLAARVEAGALAQLEVLAVQQLTPELVEPIAAASAVVLVDAVITAVPNPGADASLGLPPLHLDPLRPASASARAPLTHHATSAGLLSLTTALHGTCPSAWQLLIPIASACTGFGEELSPGTSARLAEAVELLTAWAHRHA
ncbi:hydrogenase maturation protease [Vulcanococcus limneticus Candia 3F8]|uniref:hydrogenase maturation protease n=1 Tax=Vulcanococcus limneticus TaxID=2170428 RepID=UPI000B997220|nr:hydrogenase maturation protease [Vulcanococcus limneticus]MCP9792152.1 hydrogenase maturation protease [Vulcanococcus limneticus MW73D5]MCP9893954.1 hydrogenase maturation protease [Vulcanococcus limneticus Candia 3F8]MCP9897546.1 hydrogenase maturation protease [Vulcanococcus limneticus Candia 3B3]